MLGEPPNGLATHEDQKRRGCSHRAEEEKISHKTCLFVDGQPGGQEVGRWLQRAESRTSELVSCGAVVVPIRRLRIDRMELIAPGHGKPAISGTE